MFASGTKAPDKKQPASAGKGKSTSRKGGKGSKGNEGDQKVLLPSLTEIRSSRFRSSDLLRNLPGEGELIVTYPLSGGPAQVAVKFDGKVLPMALFDNLMSVPRRIREYAEEKNKDKQYEGFVNHLVAHKGNASSNLQVFAVACKKIETRNKAMSSYMEVMQHLACEEVRGNVLVAEFWNFLLDQSKKTEAASTRFLELCAQDPAYNDTKIVEYFQTTGKVTAWFMKRVFREEAVDLSQKTKFMETILHPNPFFLTREELENDAAYGVAALRTMGFPLGTWSEDHMLSMVDEDTKNRWTALRSKEVREGLEKQLPSIMIFPTEVKAHCGKSRVEDLQKSFTVEFPEGYPGKNQAEAWQNMCGLFYTIGRTGQSADDVNGLIEHFPMLEDPEKPFQDATNVAHIYKKLGPAELNNLMGFLLMNKEFKKAILHPAVHNAGVVASRKAANTVAKLLMAELAVVTERTFEFLYNTTAYSDACEDIDETKIGPFVRFKIRTVSEEDEGLIHLKKVNASRSKAKDKKKDVKGGRGTKAAHLYKGTERFIQDEEAKFDQEIQDILGSITDSGLQLHMARQLLFSTAEGFKPDESDEDEKEDAE